MKEGSCWLWYACGPAATGMLGKQSGGDGRGRGAQTGADGDAPRLLLGGEAGAFGEGEANVDEMKQGVLRV
jgi:hypothetical protein